MQCEKESTAIAVAMASISDEAMRPKRGYDARRGLVQRFLGGSSVLFRIVLRLATPTRGAAALNGDMGNNRADCATLAAQWKAVSFGLV